MCVHFHCRIFSTNTSQFTMPLLKSNDDGRINNIKLLIKPLSRATFKFNGDGRLNTVILLIKTHRQVQIQVQILQPVGDGRCNQLSLDSAIQHTVIHFDVGSLSLDLVHCHWILLVMLLY